jgi:hypothetical protein
MDRLLVGLQQYQPGFWMLAMPVLAFGLTPARLYAFINVPGFPAWDVALWRREY